MSLLVTDKPGDVPKVWSWLSARTNLPWSADLRVIGLMRDGEIVGAVGFNGWTPKACFMHVAFKDKKSLSRKLLQAGFAYPFLEVGCDAVYGLTPLHLKDAINFNKRLGMRPLVNTVDGIFFELRRDECRWLKESH